MKSFIVSWTADGYCGDFNYNIVADSIGIVTPILLDGDATFSLIALPLGIYLLLTKTSHT